MKKILTLLLSLVLMTTGFATLTGCAKGGDDDDNDLIIDADAVTVTVAIQGDGTEKQYFNTLKRAFNKINQKVKFEVQTFASYQDGMNNYIASKSMPDIVWTTGDYHHPYSAAGHYEDLTPYFERDNIALSDYYKTSIDSARLINDPNAENYSSIWFMPRDYNRLTIAYNKKMFDAASIAYPKDDWTWDDFILICRQLRQKMDENAAPASGLSKYSFPANLLINDNVGGFTALSTLGGKIVNGEGKSVIASEETQSAYTQLRSYVKEGLFLDPSKSSSVDFARNTLAMTAMVRPVVPNYINSSVDFDFVAYPTNELTRVGAGCSGYAISAKSNVKDQAWEFLKFIGSDAGQRAFATTAGCVPALKSVAEDEGAVWRSFKNTYDKPLNHGAFIADEEKDMYLNVFDRKDPRIVLSLLKMMQDTMYSCMHDSFNTRGSIDGVTTYYQNEINNKKY